MAASDTIIGIVGAVALVAVMVGVFVYEYNNTSDDAGTDGSGDGDMPTGLAPEGDLDGDGISNADDDDVDGDGVANADDDATEITFTFTGTTAAAVANPIGGESQITQEDFMVMAGATDIEASVTFTGAGGVAPHGLVARLNGPNGTVGSTSGGAMSGAGEPGAWHIWIGTESASPTGSYDITVTVRY